MQIGFVSSAQELETDRTLALVAQSAADAGLFLAGTVQPVDAGRPAGKCDIVIALLPDGERRGISLDPGREATACRLDAGALEEVVLTVMARLPQAQALVVNKFGRQEAAGRGLVPAIAEMAARGLPVLVGVSPAWRARFLEFCGGAAQEFPPDADRITAWLLAACAAAPEAAAERGART